MPAVQHNPYQQNAVEHADPVKLVGMMYEGALRFIRRAEKSIADEDYESAHNNIMRAYAIVAELMATLDFEHGGEIAVNLELCYDYVLHLLKEANMKKEAGSLNIARMMIEPLLESWNDAFTGNGLSQVSLATPDVSTNGSNGASEVTVAAPDPAPQASPTPARKSFDMTG
jgi:flagellar secretion chaperone FliS